MGKRRLLVATLSAGTILFGSLDAASATTRRMECREWVDKQYRGIYGFTFDDEGNSLVVSYKPEGKYPLFGQSVDTWKLLWRKDLIAVFYGISEDWWAPVRVMSLHFKQIDVMVRIASEFGFTPASRSRIFSFDQKNSLLLENIETDVDELRNYSELGILSPSKADQKKASSAVLEDK